jgi:hypothetical protein
MLNYFHFCHSTIQSKHCHASYSVLQSSTSHFTVIQLLSSISPIPAIQPLSSICPISQSFNHSAKSVPFHSHSDTKLNLSHFTLIQPLSSICPISQSSGHSSESLEVWNGSLSPHRPRGLMAGKAGWISGSRLRRDATHLSDASGGVLVGALLRSPGSPPPVDVDWGISEAWKYSCSIITANQIF